MNPNSENSLPSTESERSARQARNARHNTVSTASSKSDPFASSDLGDEIQLEDFSYIKAHIPRGGSPDPLNLVSEHPSRPPNGACNLVTGRKRSASLDEDKPVSEWETIAPDDEFEESPQLPPQQLRRRKNFELVFHAQEIFDSKSNQQNALAKQERHAMLAPPRALPNLPAKRSPRFAPRLHSFHSTSSLYSDLDQTNDVPEKSLRGDLELEGKKRQPVQGLLPDHRPEILRSISKTSTSTNGDPFKYDGDLYSGFLQPSAEKEVSNALHCAEASAQSKETLMRFAQNVDEEIKVPVIREPKKEPTTEPESSHRLTGGIATLLQPQPQTETEADWQTVMTEQHFDSMQQEFQDSIAKGTGSSLADVSDMTEHDYPREYGSTDRIIQHPQKGVMPGSYILRNDKQRNIPVLVPKFSSTDGGAFPQNSIRKLPQPPPPTPGGDARFSNPFRRDGSTQRHVHESILLDMESRRDSYQTLDSDINPLGCEVEDTTPTANFGKNGRFRWSRIRETLGRDPPKTPLTIFDQPLYRLGIKESSETKKSSHVPHDEFLAKIPQLPFPLISLPEAAMLQHFRRERGEEDHTNPAGSFAARGRSTTFSTAESSIVAQAPSPSRLHFSTGSPGKSLARPAPVLHTHRMNEVLRRRDSSERIADMLISSSAILNTPPPTEPRTPTNSGWYRGRPQDATTFCGGLPRARGFSSSTIERRARKMRDGYVPNEGSLFTPSEVDLIESARVDILSRRRLADKEDKGEKIIFMGIMVLTFFFPFIGLLALWGKFDSAVSWYTHGEMHSLTKEQRGILKQQLLVEAVVYPVLIITLAVYYSVGV
ncbi:hypothetical protein G7Z17_g11838 [Cylindrodendrum hubeiense]|uniref:Uncharacterized protein n=1 Tax=Cylindrodendrum hubeiense TaxID=595255 RepID=A0A9P5LAW7_9HYPO|nr:hypothetical protein G7Z17_g11838 [Cylindrodendrum hubeiense]